MTLRRLLLVVLLSVAAGVFLIPVSDAAASQSVRFGSTSSPALYNLSSDELTRLTLGIPRHGFNGGEAARRCATTPAVATTVATEDTGFSLVGEPSGTRAINYRPQAADPNWGLTPTHLDKHLFGSGPLSLRTIDPAGTTDQWVQYMQDLAGRPPTATLNNGIEDIIGTFPRADGAGTFQFGLRVAPNSSGGYDLVTLLTKQVP